MINDAHDNAFMMHMQCMSMLHTRGVTKALLIIFPECLQGLLDDVSGGDIGVILGIAHSGAQFLVDLDTLVPSRVAKKCVGIDLVPNTRMNNLAMLSVRAQTVRGLRSDDPRPRCRSDSFHGCFQTVHV
jgi:hypothetical protein